MTSELERLALDSNKRLIADNARLRGELRIERDRTKRLRQRNHELRIELDELRAAYGELRGERDADALYIWQRLPWKGYVS